MAGICKLFSLSLAGPPEKVENGHLKQLRVELQRKYKAEELDGYCLYL